MRVLVIYAHPVETSFHAAMHARVVAALRKSGHEVDGAEALVFCFPVWCFGLPAILKGWFDRVLMPGVSFDISDPAHVKPALTHLKKIVACTTYGRPHRMAFVMGDPLRKVIKRYLRVLTGSKASIEYHAHYHMNVATPEIMERHMKTIERVMARL